MLRLACSSKGSLANALPEVSLELQSIGVYVSHPSFSFSPLLPFILYCFLFEGSFFTGAKQVLSEWANDLIAAPLSVFTEAFDHAFEQHMVGLSLSDIITDL